MTALDARRRAPPLPDPHRRCAGCRPACSSRSPSLLATLARPVADRDRPGLQPAGPGRAVPRAADRRPVRCARPAPRAHHREPASGSSSLGLLYVADSVAMFAAATLLQGVYRALDSGPLEAWYVDTTLAADPDAGIERGLSAGATVLSVAIALGALAVRRPRGARSVRRHPDPGPADPRRARARHRQPDRDPGPHGRASARPAVSRPWRPRSGPSRRSSATAWGSCARRACCSPSSAWSCSGASPWSPSRTCSRSACPRPSAARTRPPPSWVRSARSPGSWRPPARQGSCWSAIGSGSRARPGCSGSARARRSWRWAWWPARSGRSSPISAATWPTGRRTRCTRPCSTARWMGRTGPRSCRSTRWSRSRPARSARSRSRRSPTGPRSRPR